MDKTYSGKRPGVTSAVARVKGGTRRPLKWARPKKPLRAPVVEKAPTVVPGSVKPAAPKPAPVEPRPTGKFKAPVLVKPAEPKPEPVKPVEISTDDIDWSKLLQAARPAWDQTIEQAAEDLGVSVTTYKRWESGKGKPGRDGQDRILEAVADYTDLDLKDFV